MKRCHWLAIGVTAFVLLGIWIAESRLPASVVLASAGNASEIRWMLDAGHGGEDGGAVSVTGVPESGINLAITQRLDLILGFSGEPALMLRTEDTSLHDPDAVTLREKKSSDLHNRARIAEENRGTTLVSIHQNTFPQAKFRGAQTFYAPTEGSQALAEALQTALRDGLQPENSRAAKQIPDSVYLMNHIPNRAVLVECGFLSNPEEETLLRDPGYQTKIAVVLAAACLRDGADPD